MQNSTKTSEFKFLILAVIVCVINGIALNVGGFSLDVDIPEKYIDLIFGSAGGYTVLRQTLKAKASPPNQ